ncbi:TetR/AcrR family transcriptional regulator [Clavibacter michiganensis]|uniref:TetR/AcrR family transcriptional regulator n=1 Tax=Clavibacter michiganensis TaxID=28447 RepID=UPI000CE79BB6|nr:TetR family transcriptional regulator [Clavibacter michiganensis]PPF50026.1 TetR/AcrR family transcriptional regulator [Clavibacter michiganensis]
MNASDETPRPARVGRRPGTESSRSTVLAAARARFAADGFAGTTIRRVASDAGVDPSQVMQFFGSKDGLYAAVMEVPASALVRFDTAFLGPDEHLGERVARAYLEAFEASSEEAEPLMAMLRGAVANERASSQLREFIQSRLTHGMAGRGPDATLRAGLAASMLMGIAIGRRVVAVPALADADIDTLVATLGPVIQELLSAPNGG